MRIALAQIDIVFEDKETNLKTAEAVIRSQAQKGVDLCLFPEMSFTGFSMNTGTTKENDDYTIKHVSRYAINYSIAIGVGWVKDGGDICENHYTIIDKRGSIVSDYIKIHPFSYSGEDQFFRGGHSLSFFSFDGAPFTSFICYDLRFPELFRKVVNKVHAIIIPANWPNKRSEHWTTLLRARAIENQIYIFGINCVGYMDGQYYSGDSCVINPNGDVLKMLSDKDGVITYDYIDDVNEYRDTFPVINDRKMGMYPRLLECAGSYEI